MKPITKYRATASAILDTRSQKANHTFPVKLRITYRRKQKYYSIGSSLSKSSFGKATGEKPRGIFKDHSLYLKAAVAKAEDVIDSLPQFTFELFERHYFSSDSDLQNVYSAYDHCIERLKKEGRAGTAIAYQCSLNSLKKITGKKALKFSDIDVGFLQEYERKMISESNTLNTIGIYIRCLRALFNDAIAAGTAKREFYPFGKRKYQIPSTKGKKKALLLSEIEKLYLHKHKNAPINEQRSLDLWLFSYLCNGMNIADIARLKFKNIADGKITFIRTKTEHTSRKNLKSITVMITPRMEEIIERWRTEDQLPENYVFPILHRGISPMGEKDKVRQAIKTINKYVKRIAEELKITKHVTSYSARHSFATVLKRKGFSTEIISESLGHSDLKTTEVYLDSFEDETRKEISTHLTNFTNDESTSQKKAGNGEPAPRI